MLDRLSSFRFPWALLVAVMGCFLISQSLSGFPIETDILKLLPETRTDPLTERAYRQFETASGRKVVFLIASESAEEAAVSSESFYQSMLDSGLFEKISYKVDPERAKKTYEVYFPHRQALLSDEQRRALLEEQSERITSQATKSLLSPISTGSANLVNDPLFTFTEFLRELQSQGAAFTIDGELLRAEKDGVNSVVLVGVLKENAFSMTAQARFKDFYQTAKRIAESQGSDVQVLSAGVIHHAIAGTDSARHDISTIGVGSLVGVVVLVLVAFRSVGPLLVSAIPIVVGCVCALAVCVLIFDKVHLFTLVFGSSLIGVSIDYSFHYFSERLGAGASWDPRQGLKNIFPGVTLGLVTSLAAYLAMAIAPFSGLQQIALFSTVGLTAAYLTVILWYPGLLPHAARSTRPLTLEVAQQYISCWPEGKLLKQKAVFALACCAMTAFLASHLQVDDNVRALQDSPPGVLAEEELVKEIVGTSSGSQFFVVRGSSADSVLVDEETLTILLDEQVQKGALKRYRAISKVLPSAARQMENYSLLRDQVLDETSPVAGYFQDMGFEDEVVRNFRGSFLPETTEPLSVARWLESPLGELYGDLFLEGDAGQYATILVLDGVRDLSALRGVQDQLENVTFVSRADDVSALLKSYRQLSSWLVAGAYLGIFVLLLFRYRPAEAFNVILAPLGAGLAALTVTAAMGVSLNLFNTLALVLVLGIGIDYTIFFAEKPEHRVTTMHAVFLSALTTILSFGLLALSGTPVISSFGLMVLVGILVSLLLSPVAGCVGRPD